MNQFLLTGIATAALIAPAVSAAEWGTDLPAALQQAGQTGKNVFVIFTGSDWCGPCIALKNNVLSKPDFAAYAAANFVLVELDFPRSKPMPEELKAANRQLAQKYNVKGYPTMLVLSPEGKELARIVGGVSGLDGLKAELASVASDAPEGVVCVDGVCTIPDADDQDAGEKQKFIDLVTKLDSMEDPEEVYEFTTAQLERDDISTEEEIALHFYQSTAIVELATTEEEILELLEVLKEDIIPAFEDDYPDAIKPIKNMVELLEEPGFIEGFLEEKAAS